MSDEAISDYCLERYVLGELPPEEAVEVERAAAVDPRVRAALEGIETSNRDILERYPAAGFKAGLLARLEGAEDGASLRHARRRLFAATASHWSRALIIASASAVLVLAAVLIIPRIKGLTGVPPAGPGPDQTLVKGEAAVDLTKTQLLVYRKRGDLAEVLGDGNEAEAGALLQLAYVAAAEPHGVILSIDGRGGVTRHFPAEEGGSTLLSLNKKSLLPNAIELDDAPDFERFFLVTSEKPIDVKAVLEKAVKLAQDPGRARRSDLDLPAGLNQRSVLILKGEGSR
jgi:hypothetical protein